MDLHAAQQDESLQAAARKLGVLVRDDHIGSLTS